MTWEDITMLHQLFGKSGRGGRPRTFRPTVEALEDRCVPSSTPLLTRLLDNPTFNVSSLDPTNGDQNPYGVAFVPPNLPSGGNLQPGNILVSNFNNTGSSPSGNLQGHGTTIDQFTPSGQQSTFFQGPAGLGLTTALGVLPNGFVLVGSLPTQSDGLTVIPPGELLLLDRSGNIVHTFESSTFLDGPWDLTIVNRGGRSFVFVADVLSGTVTRLTFDVTANSATLGGATQIASGYAHRTDPNAVVLGPTGLTYDPNTGLLYVAVSADTAANPGGAIYSIANPLFRKTDGGTGKLVFNDPAHLQGPLGLALLPNGDLLAANGDAVNKGATQPNSLIEFTPQGRFVAQGQIDTNPAGDAGFGIAVHTSGNKVQLAAVDDDANTLEAFAVNRTP
jgi:hypothetical protein